MDFDLDQLSHAVLHLPVAARAELASRLLESLDAAESSETPEAVATAWEAELDRRERYFASDIGVGIPAADAFQRLEANVAALRTPRETPRRPTQLVSSRSTPTPSLMLQRRSSTMRSVFRNSASSSSQNSNGLSR